MRYICVIILLMVSFNIWANEGQENGATPEEIQARANERMIEAREVMEEKKRMMEEIRDRRTKKIENTDS